MEFPDRAHGQWRRLNFLFVGATALVTTCYRPNERGKAQALNDLLVFSTTATSSFMAGFLQDRWGWQPLNWFSVLLMLAAACAVLWLRYQRPTLSPPRERMAETSRISSTIWS